MTKIILIAHNLRSCHNVGSLLRTADGLGVQKVYLTGYTPYPMRQPDKRLPHLAAAVHRRIQKTALGAETGSLWEQRDSITGLLAELQAQHFVIAALEQAPRSIPLPSFKVPHKIALVVGREVGGLEPDVLEQGDIALEIPMLGKKESFNVAQAAAIGLYHCAFTGQGE